MNNKYFDNETAMTLSKINEIIETNPELLGKYLKTRVEIIYRDGTEEGKSCIIEKYNKKMEDLKELEKEIKAIIRKCKSVSDSHAPIIEEQAHEIDKLIKENKELHNYIDDIEGTPKSSS
ncbi:MAG: hypothetical protein KAS04_07065 [Candidatus Aenigmarchaeota archaeon]|nr:hypothetical protein [Candidatus Aenigmarchaeota archaeon]